MANRSNIMGLHGLKNKPSRNSFDLSHRNMFTAKVGELLPCFVQELNPGDSVKVTSSYFTRTAPLQSNAFTRLRENVQFFFVPYSALWKYFDSQVLNMTKNANGGDISRIASSLVDSQKVTTQMPCVNYKTLHAYLLKFINRTPVGSDGTVGSEFNRGCYRHAESAKLLQLLGYGNFPEQFANFKVNNDKNNNSGLNFKDVTYKNSPYLSIFRLLAYHKICNDHYLYRQWQPYNASLCNVDYLSPNSSSLLNIDDALLAIPGDSIKSEKLNLLDMRFSNLPLDYFTGVLPTSQFGSESVVNLQLSSSGTLPIDGHTDFQGLPQGNYSTSVYTTTNTPSTGYVGSDNGSLLIQGSSTSQKSLYLNSPHQHLFSGTATLRGNLSGDLGIIALRNALAAQKYKEIQLANDVDFTSQVEAHFGIKPDEKNENSVFIGGSSSMININEQINQNLSGDNKATYGAAPQGNGSASIKYTAKTYGVVIGIYRCTPVLDFAHLGIDRTLFKTDASDFVIPELDSIGMQQTFRCEVAAPAPYNDEFQAFRADDGIPDMSETYGYAPRYSEFKTSYDRYNGAFCHSLKSWVTGINFAAIKNNIWNTWGGINAPNMFACRPDIVKNLFVVSSTNNADDDQLYVGMVNMCYATRNLSRYGLPYSN
nr:MAG TPA: Major capsid protein [Microviridae sp.]